MDFLILIDALRHDFIDPRRAPFLFSLQSAASHARVIETYAFQTRPAFFAGLEPDESGICHLYKYSPRESPFKFLLPFIPLLRQFDPWGHRSLGRGVIKRIGRALCRRSGHHAAADVLSTSQIPLHLLPLFAPAEVFYTDEPRALAEHRTLFDLLRKAERSWNWIGYPRHFGSFESIRRAFESSARKDVAYLHFSELDWIGHAYGPDSEELNRSLTILDERLKMLLEPHLDSSSRIVVFGDHGMATVTNTVDLVSRLSSVSYMLGVDYVTFLDSTQARFWFTRADCRASIERLLGETPGGHVLTVSERKDLGVSDERFGELIFAIDGTGIIHPSFFDHSTDGPKGMHGYLPSVEENMTRILLYPSTNVSDLGTIKMTEMFHLMARHLDLPLPER